MSLTVCRRDIPCMPAKAVLVIALASLWLLSTPMAWADTPAVTVDVMSTPPAHNLRPDLHVSQMTLRVWLYGRPLPRGQIQVKLTAPPRTTLLSTDFPIVEGTEL